jgi:hypothetical protein
MLTEKEAAKAADKPEKLFDAGGLYLLVNPQGPRLWRLKYRMHGKEKLLAIGAYPEVSLKRAREKRDEARRLLADGIDPRLSAEGGETRGRQHIRSDRTRMARTTAEETLTHDI